MSELLPPVIASLRGDISDFAAKMGAAKAEMTGVEKGAQSSFSKIKDAMTTGVGGGALVAAGAIATLAADGIRHFEDATAAVRKFQRGVGDSAEDASKWVYAAQAMGIETDGLSTAMVRFGRNIAEHSDKFAQWNVAVAKSKDGNTDLTGTLLNVSDAFKQIHDPAQRDAMVMDLLGRQGAALIPVLQRGRDGLKEFFKEAGAHGLVFDQKQLEQGRDLSLAMHNLSEAAKGLEIQLASGTAPALTEVTTGAAKTVDFLNRIAKPIGGISGWVEGVINPGAKAMELFGFHAKKAGDDQEEMAKKVQLATAAIATGNEDAVKAMDKTVVEAAKQKIAHDGLTSSVVTAYGRMGEGAAEAALEMVATGNQSDDQLKKMADAAGKVADAYGGLGPVADMWGAQLVTNANISVDAIAKVAGEAQKMRDSMASSFESATSVVGAFGNKADVTFQDINKFFKDQVKAAQSWSNNLQALATAGLDHGLIKQLAEAGPKAAPLVAALLNDVKRGNLGAINQAQTDLNSILSNTQSMMLGYETPFFEAGSGLGEAFAGAMSAQMADLVIKNQDYINSLILQGVSAKTALAALKSPSLTPASSSLAPGTKTGKRAFALGGWVDAPPGQPVDAIVHGGEFVLSREMLADHWALDDVGGVVGRVTRYAGGDWAPAAVLPGNFAYDSPEYNNARDPNRGRPGYTMAEDGSWVGPSFYGATDMNPVGLVGPLQRAITQWEASGVPGGREQITYPAGWSGVMQPALDGGGGGVAPAVTVNVGDIVIQGTGYTRQDARELRAAMLDASTEVGRVLWAQRG